MELGIAALLQRVPPDELGATRAFYRTRPSGVGPASYAELLRARAARTVGSAPPTGFDGAPAVTELIAEAAGRRVPVRIIRPAGPPTGVHLHIHGGGFYLDSAARHDAGNTRLAGTVGAAVVSVDYRLAPEAPWPAAPDDCETAALWLIENAGELFGTARLSIGGMSAGATLVATTLLRLRDRGLAGRFAGAVLEAGTYDLSGTTPAGRLIADEYFLEAYVGHVHDRTLPDVSPAFADLAALPPTLVLIGERDVVLADNLAMVARLVAAGNRVDLRLYPEVPHGFTGHDTPIARRAARDVDDWLRRRLAR